MQNSVPKLIAIIGPTASGKTDLAIKIAIRLRSGQAQKLGIKGAEIISADSRQVYKGMDIGTGKITKKEMVGIPHYLLDVASPRQTFTVAQYQKLGTAAIKKILSKGKLPIIVGGTGFYIDALLYNYSLPSVKQNLKLRRELEKRSAEELFEKLKSLDPARAETIDRHNKVRLVRAIEIVLATKKPVPKLALWQTQGEPQYNFLKIGIKLTDAELKKRVEKRANIMIKNGLVDEVKKLVKKYGYKQIAFDAIGYKEIIAYLKNEMSLVEAVGLIKKNTRAFAKRQMTWFGADKEIKWVSKESEAMAFAKKFLDKK